jgi:ubiquinone/menaquinone biosynthesis C-methylase UbiE
MEESMERHQHNSKEMHHLARKIEFLDRPERIKAFPPEELLQMLPIKKTDNILDLGAGTGYLAIPAAQMVDGLVYALDMDPQMLEVIGSKTQDENITNIQLVKGSIDNIPLSDDSIDIVLASLVLHEVKSLSKTLQQIKRVLKEGGYFLCFEFEKIESPIEGPPMNIRISSSIMEQEIINAGFSITQKLFPRDFLYIFIVKK